MYRENKFTEALDWLWGWLLALSPLWPVPVVALISWAAAHHLSDMVVMVFIVFFIPLYFACWILSKVLRDIFSLFHR